MVQNLGLNFPMTSQQWNTLPANVLYIYIYERETSVCMCYTITVKQKTQRLFDEFSYSFNT